MKKELLITTAAFSLVTGTVLAAPSDNAKKVKSTNDVSVTQVTPQPTTVQCDPGFEWVNHGTYVSCVAKQHLGGEVTSEAARSSIGKKSQNTTPSTTPSVSPTGSITPTVAPTVSITPTGTPTVSVTPTVTPEVSVTPSVTPEVTPSVTPTGAEVAAASDETLFETFFTGLQNFFKKFSNFLAHSKKNK